LALLSPSLSLYEAADSFTPSSAERSNIAEKDSKLYREVRAIFNIVDPVDNTREKETTNTDRQNREDLLRELREKQKKLNQFRFNSQRDQTCIFSKYTISDGVFKGFDGVRQNKFQPVFHSQTPEDFHRRLTFLHQCTRQGRGVTRTRAGQTDGATNTVPKNSVFGRQPIAVLRIGDFFHTKVVIENISFEYGDAPWDLNPEGMGMQFMMADISITMKVIGGQSLATPINMLQNAVSFNYYANSTYFNTGTYVTPALAEARQLNDTEAIEVLQTIAQQRLDAISESTQDNDIAAGNTERTTGEG
jgi:hypothetical protein